MAFSICASRRILRSAARIDLKRWRCEENVWEAVSSSPYGWDDVVAGVRIGRKAAPGKRIAFG
jgi:hypothetical protein